MECVVVTMLQTAKLSYNSDHAINDPLASATISFFELTRPSTEIALTWTRSSDSVTTGYVLRRGTSQVARFGDATGFGDIGLSATRTYVYQLCPIDRRGVAGPCAITQARTPAPK